LNEAMSTFSEITWARKKLGLGDRVSLKSLRERYLFLARRLHPDVRNRESGPEENHELAEITRAYQLMVAYLESVAISLSDDEVRRNDPHAYHSYRFHDWMGGKS